MKIDAVDGNTLTMAGTAAESLTAQTFVIHEKIQKIRTMQELTDAITAAGVLPGGVSIDFDINNQVFTIPLTFAAALDPIQAPLELRCDLGSVLSLSTSATGSLGANISDGLTLFVDIDGDGSVVLGESGTLTKDSDEFTSSSITFTADMVGQELKIDGDSYKIKAELRTPTC